MKYPLLCCLLLASGVGCAAGRAPLMVNEDAWYFIGHRPAEEMTVEGLKAHVDRYAAGADGDAERRGAVRGALRHPQQGEVWPGPLDRDGVALSVPRICGARRDERRGRVQDTRYHPEDDDLVGGD